MTRSPLMTSRHNDLQCGYYGADCNGLGLGPPVPPPPSGLNGNVMPPPTSPPDSAGNVIFSYLRYIVDRDNEEKLNANENSPAKALNMNLQTSNCIQIISMLFSS
ncbi:hypothetical protein GH714_034494 [Hevea brasiliensis]|uniref:Uncharacterized protein n=1 Tax=Hevea brasiliensis TaxID=3981 RepID=A0A6A6NAR6_HEVBR|nr:hypothetical protein GH714_034494 [Hevea brasiliensis]